MRGLLVDLVYGSELEKPLHFKASYVNKPDNNHSHRKI